MRRLLLAVLCAPLLLGIGVGCGKPALEGATLDKVDPTGPLLEPLPDPDGQGGHVGRAPRRLTVAQLDQAIRVAVGRPWDDLDDLAPTLGQADYALLNTENIEPTLVFAKFLEDGARRVCTQTASMDLAAATQANRVLSNKITSVANLTQIPDGEARANLVYLSTRFWGQPLSGKELDEYAALFTAVSARAQTVNRRGDAFAALCIALMTDPRFLTY